VSGDVAAWSTPAFLAAATDWIDQQLIAHGLERTGPVTQPHLRPWSTALRAETTGGPVWLKAPAAGSASEVALYALLSRVVPDHVLVPLALDHDRAWILLPDGGPPLGARDGSQTGLASALAEYGRVQRTLEPHVDELLAAGVTDMRPEVMPERFQQVLGLVQGTPVGKRLQARRGVVEGWWERLAASAVPVSLDHQDLHPHNVLGPPWRFYDWGDAVVSHSFTAAWLPLEFDGTTPEAYLSAFADLAPPEVLREDLEAAKGVAKVIHVLIWERSIAAARRQGIELEPRIAAAPLEAAATILD
jgi:hypothetical protein